MANLAAADLWRLTFDFTDGSRGAHVGLDYRIVSITGVPPTDVDLVQYGDSAFGPLFKALMSNVATYQACRSLRLSPVLGRPVFQVNSTNAGVGTAGSNLLPPQTAGLASFYSALAGRSFRCRKYMPFPDVADDQSGGTTASYRVRLGTLADQYKNPATLSGSGGGSAALQPVVFHRKLLSSTDLTTRVARVNWASARRRAFYRPPRRRKHA